MLKTWKPDRSWVTPKICAKTPWEELRTKSLNKPAADLSGTEEKESPLDIPQMSKSKLARRRNMMFATTNAKERRDRESVSDKTEKEVVESEPLKTLRRKTLISTRSFTLNTQLHCGLIKKNPPQVSARDLSQSLIYSRRASK